MKLTNEQRKDLVHLVQKYAKELGQVELKQALTGNRDDYTKRLDSTLAAIIRCVERISEEARVVGFAEGLR